jgi:anti-sigma regulatory factor (Ser/Thr protein kinase)
LSTFTASAGRFAAAAVSGSPVSGSTAEDDEDDEGAALAGLDEPAGAEEPIPDDGGAEDGVTLERALVHADVIANAATTAIPSADRVIREDRLSARMCDELCLAACCTDDPASCLACPVLRPRTGPTLPGLHRNCRIPSNFVSVPRRTARRFANQTPYPSAMDLRTVLPCDASSVGKARRLIRQELAAFGEADLVEPDLVDAAGLLVSELVTNAVVHARTDVTLHVRLRRGVLRIEVTDGSPVLPAPRRPTGLTGTGRGLQLVDHLADRWGVDKARKGKTIWFELAPSARAVG